MLKPLEFLDLLSRVIVLVPFWILINIIKNTYSSLRYRLSVREYITVAVIRTFLTCLTPRQIVHVSPSSYETYRTWMNKQSAVNGTLAGISSFVETENILADDRHKLLWIGRSHLKPDKVILFLHGGGYNVPLSTGHLDCCLGMIRHFQAKSIYVAVAVLEYGLTPYSGYPSQFRQARDGLASLLRDGFEPENIVIGGDSAGGNLALALLSHLKHPCPLLEKLTCDRPLAGAFLISPWLTDDTSTPSFKRNSGIDMLSPGLVKRSTHDFVASSTIRNEHSKKQGWIFPLHASPEWWNAMQDVVSQIYITSGEREMFRDHIIDFAQLLQNQNRDYCENPSLVQLDIGKGEIHDHMLLWAVRRGPNPALERLNTWLDRILRLRK